MKGRIALIMLLAVISVFFIASIIMYAVQSGNTQQQLSLPAEDSIADGIPAPGNVVLQPAVSPFPEETPDGPRSGPLPEPVPGQEPEIQDPGTQQEPEPDYVMLYESHAGAIQERREERQADLARRLATPTPPPPKPSPAPKPAATTAPTSTPAPAPPPPAPAPEPTPDAEPESEAFLLARMIHSESHWESYNGKIAVGQCAYDRWKNTSPASGQSGSWNPGGSKSLGAILTAAGQFVLADSEKVCANCIAAANDVIGGARAFPDYIITNFRPRPADDTEDWIAPYIGHIGGHAFYGYPR